MRVLITGGAGFIGSHLAEHLEGKGFQVVILDNFSTGNKDNLQGLNCEVIEGDILNKKTVDDAVRGVSVIFHYAALCSVAESIKDPASTHAVNVLGTLNVLEASRKAGVSRVLLASSSSVYGDCDVIPLHEDLTPQPISPYATSKLTAEFYCKYYLETYHLETVILRYFNVFGPRQDSRSAYSAVIPKFIDSIFNDNPIYIYGDGSQSRDFTYVTNVLQANLTAAMAPSAAGQIMNISCGCRYNLFEILDRLQSCMNKEIKPILKKRRLGDIAHSQASIERARNIINYLPSIDLEEGLQRTVDWFSFNNANV